MPRALIVSTSAAKLHGVDTGLWLEEAAGPYYVFKQAGYEVSLASPAGGAVPIDAASLAGEFFTPAAQRFMSDDATKALLTASTRLADVDPASVDIAFVAGGHGAVADLAADPALGALLVAVADAGRPVAAVCHGVVALLATEASTARLVKGKRVTGFSDAEERAVGKVELVGGEKNTLEARLRAAGGVYAAGPDWAPHVVVDDGGGGVLVTGQNPASSELTAARAVKAANAPPTPAVDAGGHKRSVTGTPGPERVDPVDLARSAPLAPPPSWHSPRRPPI